MSAYLYCFGYETPSQLNNNSQNGWDDEDSQTLLIEAETEEAALRWGQEISERFIKLLFKDEMISWKRLGYANGIERADLDSMHGTLLVREGEYPDFSKWLSIPNLSFDADAQVRRST
jgi:hypothetical protein